MTAIVVSAMSDRLLVEAEFDEDDPNDIDATTLDEVVNRVTATYTANADARMESLKGDYEAKLNEMQKQLRAATEEGRRHALAIEGRARTLARRTSQGIRWGTAILLFAGAFSLITGHPFQSGWIGAVIGFAVVLFVLLELVGILRHVAEWGDLLESAMTKHFRNWLGAGVPVGEERAKVAPMADQGDGLAPSPGSSRLTGQAALDNADSDSTL